MNPVKKLLYLENQSATTALAEWFAAHAVPGDIFALNGDLGIGKSCFARAFIQARTNALEVPSPTFTLVQSYIDKDDDQCLFWHFDLYRLEDQNDIWELGIEEAFDDGISLIEWASKADTLIPADRIDILFLPGNDENSRTVEISTHDPRHEKLISALLDAAKQGQFGLASMPLEDETKASKTDITLDDKLTASRKKLMTDFIAGAPHLPVDRDSAIISPLAADASFRQYFRLSGTCTREGTGGGTGGGTVKPAQAVIMDAPPDKEDIRPFMAIDRYLRTLGYSAPEIYHSDPANGFLLLEDLGDMLFSVLLQQKGSSDRPTQETLYELAVDFLADIHRHDPPPALTTQDNDQDINPETNKSLWIVPHYDDDLLLQELALPLDWAYPALNQGELLAAEARAEFMTLWQPLLDKIRVGATGGEKPVLVLRDFHVNNLIWLPDRTGLGRLGLLDFQDAVIGSPAYDLVSLLQDARRDVPEALANRMFDRYLASHMAGIATDKAEFATNFRATFEILGAQRNLKIIGIFTRLWQRDGKSAYLALIPDVWKLVSRNLSHPALFEVKQWLDHYFPAHKRGNPAKS